MKEVCIIGAGASGLVSIKECLDAGFIPTCYERAGWTGGLWRYHDEDVDGFPSVAKTTIINSCKEQSALSDFPPRKELPNYCHNTLMVKYLDEYSENFGLQKYVKTRHEVVSVRQEGDKWIVTVNDNNSNEEKAQSYDAVMICTGHHVKPLIPTFKGQEKFKGIIMHTHSYKKPTGFEDKNICVVGIGNSGGDAAAELSVVGKQCYLSTRRGAWISHRVGPFGIPLDIFFMRRINELVLGLMSFEMRCSVMESALNQRFDHETYGMKPKHRFHQQHPTVNDTLPNRIISGTVIVKGDIKEFTENGIIFVGDTEETPLDIVVLATGYEVYFPFVDKSIVDPKKNEIDLYKHVFSPNVTRNTETLAFIGNFQPVGALIPISEMQARWVCQLLLGKVSLPSKQQMLADIAEKKRMLKSRYYDASRHTIQVDWLAFMDETAEQFGAKPDLKKIFFTDIALWSKMMFGPALPYHYRLNGPGKWLGAREAIMTVEERLKAGTSQGIKSTTATYLEPFKAEADLPFSQKLSNACADVLAIHPFIVRAAKTFFMVYIMYSFFLWLIHLVF
jgi:dimethylaniline monooxygenase (N-oxide forming)